MTRDNYRQCEFCTAYVPAGDGGECHKAAPTVGDIGQRWPRVAPTEGCREFVLNPAPLFDRIEEQDRQLTLLLGRVTELEDEVEYQTEQAESVTKACQQEIARYTTLLGSAIENRQPVTPTGRVPLATVGQTTITNTGV